MLVDRSNMKEIVNLKAKLAKEFSMKDLGSAKKILGMRISKREKWLLKKSQIKYVEKVLKRFKPVNVLFGGHFKLSKAHTLTTEDAKTLMSEVPYALAVSTLMYAIVYTRSNIAQAGGVVSRYLSNPEKEHLKGIKWIWRYLKESFFRYDIVL